MAEQKIIADFPKCPACGSELKVSEMGCAALKESGKIPKDMFTQLKVEVAPLEQPVMAGVLVQAIGTSYDACGACGTPRVSRAMLLVIPVQGQMPVPGNGPQQRPGFRPGR